MVYNWSINILDAFFPSVCRLCGAAGKPGIDICACCLTVLPRITRACRHCGLPLGESDLICGACLRRLPPHDSVIAPFEYGWPIDALVSSLKFRGDLAVGRLLGTLLANCIADVAGPLPELMVPVPLHHRRLRERGFNQATEIARALKRRLDVPISNRVLVRSRADTPQTRLSGRERRRNTRGAFQIGAPLRARHVAIVDDVMTTGSTVKEAARILRTAGAARVDVWVFARAY